MMSLYFPQMVSLLQLANSLGSTTPMVKPLYVMSNYRWFAVGSQCYISALPCTSPMPLISYRSSSQSFHFSIVLTTLLWSLLMTPHFTSQPPYAVIHIYVAVFSPVILTTMQPFVHDVSNKIFVFLDKKIKFNGIFAWGLTKHYKELNIRQASSCEITNWFFSLLNKRLYLESHLSWVSIKKIIDGMYLSWCISLVIALTF